MFISAISKGLIRKFSTEAAISLPELKYSYSALEPVLSSKLLEVHHKKHHQTYVNNLNAALQQFDGNSPVIKRLRPTLTIIKWQHWHKLLNSTLEAISTIQSIGKIWLQLAKEEDNTQMQNHHLPSKLSSSSNHMKI